MTGFGNSIQGLPVKGYVKIWSNGELIREGSNRVVEKGLECLAKLINSESITLPTLFSFGTGSAATIDSMEALQGTKLFSKQANLVRDGRSLIWSWEGSYDSSETVTVGEIGIFNPENLMLARFVPIPAFTLAQGASIKISWEIKVGG